MRKRLCYPNILLKSRNDVLIGPVDQVFHICGCYFKPDMSFIGLVRGFTWRLASAIQPKFQRLEWSSALQSILSGNLLVWDLPHYHLKCGYHFSHS